MRNWFFLCIKHLIIKEFRVKGWMMYLRKFFHSFLLLSNFISCWFLSPFLFLFFLFVLFPEYFGKEALFLFLFDRLFLSSRHLLWNLIFQLLWWVSNLLWLHLWTFLFLLLLFSISRVLFIRDSILWHFQIWVLLLLHLWSRWHGYMTPIRHGSIHFLLLNRFFFIDKSD